MKTSNLALSMLFLFPIIGCLQAPDGFPPLTPCVVTVTDNGVPVEKVFVQIDTIPHTDSLAVCTKTDAQGQAVMQTQLGTFSQPGVPVGKLVMALMKAPEVPDFKSMEEREKMTYEQGRAYGAEIEARRAKMPLIIPLELTNTKTSPLTMDAVTGKPIKWNVALEEFRKATRP